MGTLSRNGRAFTSLKYELCLFIETSEKKATSDIQQIIIETFLFRAEQANVSYMAHVFGTDHVTFIFNTKANIELAKFINAYKTWSSRCINKRYKFKWTGTYCVCSVGNKEDVDVLVEDFVTRHKLQKKG